MTKKEQTKEKIQQAAYKCVARYGFEKTTLDDIAKEVGLNKASLYYYYKNKEDIFFDVTTTTTRRFVETLQQSTLAHNGSMQEKVTHYLVERSMYFLELVEQVHISEETLRQVEPMFQELVRDVANQEIAFLKTMLDEGVKSGTIQTATTQTLAANFIVLAEGIKEQAKRSAADKRDFKTIGKEVKSNLHFMLEILFAGLKG